MSGLSVAKIVRRVAQEHQAIADPKALAPFVMEALRGEEEAALERLLPAYVATVLRRRPAAEGQAWESFLEERIPTAEGYVFGRDATAPVLRDGAERRRSFAGRLDRRAVQYDATADAMDAEHAVTAGALSTLGQSIASLAADLHDLSRYRTRLEHTTKVKQVAEEAEQRLRALVAAQDNPRVAVLRQQRDALATLCTEMRQQAERWQYSIEHGGELLVHVKEGEGVIG
jgi:hypothetical protein